MSAKIIFFAAFVAVASAGILAPAYYAPAPTIIKQVQPTIIKKVVAEEAPANYEFQYEVNDATTGDVHSQNEKAENGAIKGSYQLNDADGFVRIVDYTADDTNGFQATVRREPLTVVKKIIAQPTVTKIIQPTVTKFIQPAPWAAAPVHGWQ